MALVTIVTTNVGAAEVLAAQAALVLRGHTVALMAEGTVTSSNLNTQALIVCLLNSEGATTLVGFLNGYLAGGIPLLIGRSAQAATFSTTSIVNLLGVVAACTKATSTTPVLATGWRTEEITSGYKSGYALSWMAAASEYQSASGLDTIVCGNTLMLDTSGRAVMCAVNPGVSRHPEVGGTFASRVAWCGAYNAGAGFLGDGALSIGLAAAWCLGTYVADVYKL